MEVGVLRKLRGLLMLECGNIVGGGGNGLKLTRFEVGNGSQISFWHDVWCEDHSLKDAFPEL
jgi:hypothetical protein